MFVKSMRVLKRNYFGLVKEREGNDVCLKVMRVLKQGIGEKRNVFELLKERGGINVCEVYEGSKAKVRIRRRHLGYERREKVAMCVCEV